MPTATTYFSAQDVADRLGVSVFTIRRYIRAGKLRAIRLDGTYRLSRDDLAEFLQSREIGGPASAVGAAAAVPGAAVRGAETAATDASDALERETIEEA